MRKFRILGMLALTAMLAFPALAFADETPRPDFTDVDAQSIDADTNASGVGTTEGQVWTGEDGDATTFNGQSYRMNPDATFTGGNNETGFMSPTDAQLNAANGIKWDSTNNKVIHSAYSKTSDACASCHAVHTSVNDTHALLQWEDPQTACWACHDGTVAATYDVVTGTHSGGRLNSAGLFGTGDGTEAGLSNHGMSPSELSFVKTSAAPGGSENAADDNLGKWTTDFTCVACHDPHGSLGSARILNPNVNGYAEVQNGIMVENGGETLTVDPVDATIYQASKGYWLSGHGYDPVVTVDGVEVTDFTVNFLKGQIKFASAPAAGAVVKATYFPGLIVDMDVNNKLTATETVTYKTGINTFCGACHTDYNNEGKVPVYQKDADGNIVKDADGNPIITSYKTGGAYAFKLGNYREAYRHSVGFTRNTLSSPFGVLPESDSTHDQYPGLKFDQSNKRSGQTAPTVDCLTCHFAHGTSDEFMEDSVLQQGQIAAFGGVGAVNAAGDPVFKTYDTTRTSALKRLPNMGVCQACHNKQGAAPADLFE